MNTESKTALFFFCRDFLVVMLLVSIMAACVYLVRREREREKVEEQIQEDHSKIDTSSAGIYWHQWEVGFGYIHLTFAVKVKQNASDTATKYPNATK